MREFTFLVGSGNMLTNWNINTRSDSNGGQQPRKYVVADDVNRVPRLSESRFKLYFFRFTLHVYCENMAKTSLRTRLKEVGERSYSSGSLNLGDEWR